MSAKNLRLLGLEPSPARQPTMEETIAALQAELARGEAIYNKDELDTLARKLADYEYMLQRMLAP